MEQSSDLDSLRQRQESLLNSLGLIDGMPITLVKVAEEDSERPQQETISGHLDRLGQFGYAISVNQGTSTTPPLTQIDVHDGRTYLRCSSSIYELATIKKVSEPTRPEAIKRPKSVTTSKGSVYTYLPDGRTQRYKTVEQDLKEPQNILVYIPDLSSLKNWQHFQKLPEWFREYPNKQVMEILAADYVQNENKSVFLKDVSGKIIKDNVEAASKETLLCFIDKESGQIEFALPVVTEPVIGFTTFDARFYQNDKGENKYKCHIGNDVINIEY
jgi:hypothetical protein